MDTNHNKPFEQWRIKDAAKLIEADLTNRYRNGDNPDLDAILKEGQAWDLGLNNAELALAMISALAAVQKVLVDRLAAYQYGRGDA